MSEDQEIEAMARAMTDARWRGGDMELMAHAAHAALAQFRADAECERIMSMTEAELDASIRAEGRDPDAVVADMRVTIKNAMDEAQSRPALSEPTKAMVEAALIAANDVLNDDDTDHAGAMSAAIRAAAFAPRAASGDIEARAKRLYNHVINLAHADTVQSDKDAISAITAALLAERERERNSVVQWAAGRWVAEVASRPMQNIHRRSLDDTWRQVIRHFGGDGEALCGPCHDAMLDAAAIRTETKP